MKNWIILVFALLTFGVQAQVVQEQISFVHSNCNFKGTIHWPEGDGPHPVAVLIPGSGQNDRHGTIQMVGGNIGCLYPGLEGNTLRPYRDLATGLAMGGYAVLTYDEIVISCPGTTVFNFENLWMPANSALELLRSHPKTKEDKIYLIGHSEGAMLAPCIFRQNTDVAAVISIGGARTPLDSIMANQIISFTQMCGGNMNDAEFQADQILQYFNALRQGETNLPDLFGAKAVDWKTYIEINDSVAINYNQLPVPFLMIGLGEDVNVPPEELDRFQSEIDNPQAEFYSIEGLNHYMTTATEPTVSQVLTDTVIQWLNGVLLSNIEEHNQRDSGLHLFPNPTYDQIHLDLVDYQWKNLSWKIVDTSGNIRSQNSQVTSHNGSQLVISTQDLLPGMYILELRLDGKRYLERFAIVR
jgi:pimeloyl-ACP methyl ester carboxylesterase